MIAPYRETVLPTLTVRRAPWWRLLLAPWIVWELARRRKRLLAVTEAAYWRRQATISPASLQTDGPKLQWLRDAACLLARQKAALAEGKVAQCVRRRPWCARGTRPRPGVVVTYGVRDAIEALRSERWLPPFCRRCGRPHPTRLSRRCS